MPKPTCLPEDKMMNASRMSSKSGNTSGSLSNAGGVFPDFSSTRLRSSMWLPHSTFHPTQAISFFPHPQDAPRGIIQHH